MRATYSRAQLTFTDEIIVDNFAGGGGASCGIELATGRPVEIAINHDPAAVLMNKTNHRWTTHYEESVWAIDPETVCRGRPVGLAWFSPDCKHFSKAKGAALVDRKIRGLAWIVLRWAGTVRPRVMIVENVEEFTTWGPVRRGYPIKSKSGQTFKRWVEQLRALDYVVEWRELVAADYGAPTSRKRFVCIARCDGCPIVWPERTHAPRDSAEVASGKYLPWRSAAEIIDWTLPSPSIFDTKAEIKTRYGLNAVRPLAINTMRRIIRGIDKFIIRSGDPFIVQVNHGGFCGQEVNNPLQTITAKHGYGVISPSLIQYHSERTERVRGQTLEDPICTVDGSNRYGLSCAFLHKYFSGVDGARLDAPLPAVTAVDHNSLAAAYMVKYYGGEEQCQPVGTPLHTVTAKNREGLALAHITKYKGKNIGQNPDEPLQTIIAGDGQFGVIKTTVVRYLPGAELGHWTQVRRLLNKYCGYTLADDEVLLLVISDIPFFIGDIGLRMLTPRELYNAQGFPPDYIIDHDYIGKPYPRTEQVARCGNAVCPPMATAVVRVNMPEWCTETIINMAQFNRMVSL